MYEKIYNRSVAGAIGAVCMMALVLTQLTIVQEAVAHLRPTWAPAQTWSAALGFELATFAIGMIGAVAGFDGWMRTALGAFLFVSTFFGFDGSMQTQLGPQYVYADLWGADPMQWMRALIEGSFQAVMYVGVVFSVHRLYAKGEKEPPARFYGAEPVRGELEPGSVRKFGVPMRMTNEILQAPPRVVTRLQSAAKSGPDWPAIERAVKADPSVTLQELADRFGNGVHRSTVMRGLRERGLRKKAGPKVDDLL